MAIRLLHTADLHLGMKFSERYPPAVRDRLVKARWEALADLVASANQENATLMVIAGDLFHSQNVTRRNLKTAAEALGQFAGRLVLILPGNHDFWETGKGSLWDTFLEFADDRVMLLSEPKPYDLLDYELPIVVYPGPCIAKHASQNAIGWIAAEKRKPDCWHIGIAHGSLEGVSPDFEGNYYPMTMAELQRADLDVWLLGHTHSRRPEVDQGREDRIFLAGTPEPDGFDCRHGGSAWLIDLHPDRSVTYRSLPTGRLRFAVVEAELAGEDDLEALQRHCRQLSPERNLLKLYLHGRLPQGLFDQVSALLTELEQQVLYLEKDTSGLFRRITKDDIDREFTQGSFPHRLLLRLAEAGEDPRALQLAYDLIQEARS